MTPRRSFTILDALLLVASTALGLALCVSFSRVIDPFPIPPMPAPPVVHAPALSTFRLCECTSTAGFSPFSWLFGRRRFFL